MHSPIWSLLAFCLLTVVGLLSRRLCSITRRLRIHAVDCRWIRCCLDEHWQRAVPHAGDGLTKNGVEEWCQRQFKA